MNELKEENDDDNNDNDDYGKNFYEKYLTEEEVEKGLKEKTLFEGLIHINSKNRNESYVKLVDKEIWKDDIKICSVRHRNRALENEIVIVKLLEGEEEEKAKAEIQKEKEKNELKDIENYKKYGTNGIKLNDYVPERGN